MKKHDIAKKMGMINGKSKPSQKGKMSLNSVGKNEGEKNYLGKDEQPRA